MKNKEKSYLLTLILMAESDRYDYSMEDKFIQEIATRLGLSSEEVTELKGVPDIRYSFPETEQEKMHLFYELFFLMKIDGTISTREEGMLKKIGLLLHINPMMIVEFVEIAKQYLSKPIPEGMLLEVLRKYLN